eukprot:EG_transcript_21726
MQTANGIPESRGWAMGSDPLHLLLQGGGRPGEYFRFKNRKAVIEFGTSILSCEEEYEAGFFDVWERMRLRDVDGPDGPATSWVRPSFQRIWCIRYRRDSSLRSAVVEW